MANVTSGMFSAPHAAFAREKASATASHSDDRGMWPPPQVTMHSGF